MPDPSSGRFSEELREGTREAHEVANRSAFVEKLLAGELGVTAYARLATQHFFIYTALEEVAESMRSDPVAGQFVIDTLQRVPALTEDLEFLLGPRWAEQVTPNVATQNYCRRLRSVARTWPGGFVAHHYTRYLGDVAGGQVVRSRLRAHHGINGSGAKFYEFDGIGPLPTFRRHYRSLLDATSWEPAERGRVIAEAKHAFALNTAVLAELARDTSA